MTKGLIMNCRIATFAALLLAVPLAPATAQVATSATEPDTRSPHSGLTVYAAKVIARYPHDETAFTQGLVWHDGALFESTGREGQSGVREVDLERGGILRHRPIPPDQFGEGLAVWGDEMISLTWRNGAVHRWDADTLEPISSTGDFPFEGWGLTSLGEGLVLSDGTDTLRVLHPQDYTVRREIQVTFNGKPVRRLNELEAIDGLIYANIWHSPFIVAIDPASGVVRMLIDLRELVASVPVADGEAVLNGIAWDSENRRLFVTGKLWPTLFEIELVETGTRLN